MGSSPLWQMEGSPMRPSVLTWPPFFKLPTMMAERGLLTPPDPPLSSPTEWGLGPGVRYVFMVVLFSKRGTWSPALVNRAACHPRSLGGFSRKAAAGAWRYLAELDMCISLGFQPVVSHVSWMPTSSPRATEGICQGLWLVEMYWYHTHSHTHTRTYL